MNFYITGSTRGLGKYLAKEFSCIEFNRPYDLSKDQEKIVNKIEDNSTVILNAHANGSQIDYVKMLKDRCNLVICGTVAAVYQDPQMPDYSKQKYELEKYVVDVSLKNKNPILYLRLTNSSYKDFVLISNTIKFWLENPNFTFAGFNINE